MTFQLGIPNKDGENFNLAVQPSDPVFVLGANGTGKSALMYRLNLKYKEKARWISAHRRTWLESSRPSMTLATKVRTEETHKQYRLEPSARWTSHNDGFDQQAAIVSLVERMNAQNRASADAMRSEDVDDARRKAKEGYILAQLNTLLEQANLAVSIDIGQDSELLARKGASAFGVDRMSDGERTVLLLAAQVLTSDPGDLLLIDEPEKHLHTSIAAPLLSALFACRPDCYFVIATHDLALPTANPHSKILLLRGCTHGKDRVIAWDMDVLPSSGEIPEDLKTAILGSRRTMIFVEGEQDTSLDLPMYGLVFPDVSVIPMGSCGSVISAVNSVRALACSHRLRAFGIIDRDARDEQAVQALERKGVYVTDCCEIESLYYDPDIQRKVAGRRVSALGGDVEALLAKSYSAVIQEMERCKDGLAKHMADEKAFRRGQRELRDAIKQSESDVKPTTIDIHLDSIRQNERKTLNRRLAERDINALISQYPIKRSAVPNEIAHAIGLPSRKDYESAVITLLQDDAEAVSHIRGRFGALWQECAPT